MFVQATSIVLMYIYCRYKPATWKLTMQHTGITPYRQNTIICLHFTVTQKQVRKYAQSITILAHLVPLSNYLESQTPCWRCVLGITFSLHLFQTFLLQQTCRDFWASYARYACRNTYRSCVKCKLFLAIWIKIGMGQQMLVKLPNIKFNENPFSGPRAVTFGWIHIHAYI
jgi:hypothetical protein